MGSLGTLIGCHVARLGCDHQIGERHCHRSEGEGRKCEKRIGEGVDEVFLNTLKKVMEWKNGKNETT